MVRIGIRELRDNLTATIRRVRAGESFEVTHDGEPVAILAPTRQSRIEELVATGQATAPRAPFRSPSKRYPIVGGRTSQEILDEQRADRI